MCSCQPTVGLTILSLLKFCFHFTNSLFYSWLTTALPVYKEFPAPACKMVTGKVLKNVRLWLIFKLPKQLNSWQNKAVKLFLSLSKLNWNYLKFANSCTCSQINWNINAMSLLDSFLLKIIFLDQGNPYTRESALLLVQLSINSKLNVGEIEKKSHVFQENLFKSWLIIAQAVVQLPLSRDFSA